MQEVTERLTQLLEGVFSALGRIFSKKWVRVTTYVFSVIAIFGSIGDYASPSDVTAPTTIGAVIWTVVVASLCAVAAFYFGKNQDGPGINLGGTVRRKGSPKRKLTDEEQSLVQGVRDAQKALSSVTRTQGKSLKSVKKELAELEDMKGRRIATGGGVQVFQRWIVTPQGSGSIIGVTASAEDNTSINKRLTATRLVALNVFALAAPKKKGGGNAYVVIEGPHISGVAAFSGDKQQTVGPKAYSLAAQINNAARQAAADAPHRPAKIEALKQKIAELESAPEVVKAKLGLLSAINNLPDDLREFFE